MLQQVAGCSGERYIPTPSRLICAPKYFTLRGTMALQWQPSHAAPVDRIVEKHQIVSHQAIPRINAPQRSSTSRNQVCYTVSPGHVGCSVTAAVRASPLNLFRWYRQPVFTQPAAGLLRRCPFRLSESRFPSCRPIDEFFLAFRGFQLRLCPLIPVQTVSLMISLYLRPALPPEDHGQAGKSEPATTLPEWR